MIDIFVHSATYWQSAQRRRECAVVMNDRGDFPASNAWLHTERVERIVPGKRKAMRLPLRASYSISAFALLGAMGCGADAGPNVAEETGTATQELVTALPKRGGNGGTAWSTSYAREYLKFQARTGYYVDALAFTYALFDNSVLETGFYGGGGGMLSQNVYCPDGYIVGYFGTADSYLNSFSVICENMHVSPPDNRRNAVTYLPPNNGGAIGRQQGAPFREECPQGQVIKYFVIWSGAFVDAIQGFCGPRLS